MPSEFTNKVITDAGKNLIASAVADNKIVFVKALSTTSYIGTGLNTITAASFNGGPEGTISTVSSSNNVARIITEFSNQSAGTLIKTIAITAKLSNQADSAAIVFAVQSDNNYGVYIPSSDALNTATQVVFNVSIGTGLIEVTDGSAVSLGEWSTLINRVVTTHSAGNVLVGDNQTILGQKTFDGSIYCRNIIPINTNNFTLGDLSHYFSNSYINTETANIANITTANINTANIADLHGTNTYLNRLYIENFNVKDSDDNIEPLIECYGYNGSCRIAINNNYNYTTDIIPISNDGVNLGIELQEFYNVWAKTFHGRLLGNATSATTADTATTALTANSATKATKAIYLGTDTDNVIYANSSNVILPTGTTETKYLGSSTYKFNTIYAKTFNGNATSATTAISATTATTATSANTAEHINILGRSANSSCPLVFTANVNSSTATSVQRQLYTDTINALYYNPATNTLSCTKFSGDLIGTATSATTATTATSATTANNADNVNILGNSSSSSYPLVFTSSINSSTSTRSARTIYTDTVNSLYYNPSTNTLSCNNANFSGEVYITGNYSSSGMRFANTSSLQDTDYVKMYGYSSSGSYSSVNFRFTIGSAFRSALELRTNYSSSTGLATMSMLPSSSGIFNIGSSGVKLKNIYTQNIETDSITLGESAIKTIGEYLGINVMIIDIYCAYSSGGSSMSSVSAGSTVTFGSGASSLQSNYTICKNGSKSIYMYGTYKITKIISNGTYSSTNNAITISGYSNCANPNYGTPHRCYAIKV